MGSMSSVSVSVCFGKKRERDVGIICVCVLCVFYPVYWRVVGVFCIAATDTFSCVETGT